ncbi:hypothetical protein, partial [Xylanibacter rodentium]|uniref:hypothetical protein n=1 Tax=Xylanibacter rodentium TaxID=2736289 RepID=UPI002589A48C
SQAEGRGFESRLPLLTASPYCQIQQYGKKNNEMSCIRQFYKMSIFNIYLTDKYKTHVVGRN